MKDFKRGGFERRGRDDRGFDRGGRGGDRGFEKRMFPATCADCGSRCEVPFRPTGDKPVLCNNCFRGSDDRGFKPQRREERFSRDEKPVRADGNREQFEQLNAKLDMILKELDKLKQVSKIHTIDNKDAFEMTDEKLAKKEKKAKKQEKEEIVEVIAEEKPAKKAAKKEAKKATKKSAKKAK
jgi:CxxC-x17-CxxC domain-containing protein